MTFSGSVWRAAILEKFWINSGILRLVGCRVTFSCRWQVSLRSTDQIGLVDMDGGYLKPILDITPLNTHSDWA
jgi:hypothetical protein